MLYTESLYKFLATSLKQEPNITDSRCLQWALDTAHFCRSFTRGVERRAAGARQTPAEEAGDLLCHQLGPCRPPCPSSTPATGNAARLG